MSASIAVVAGRSLRSEARRDVGAQKWIDTYGGEEFGMLVEAVLNLTVACRKTYLYEQGEDPKSDGPRILSYLHTLRRYGSVLEDAIKEGIIVARDDGGGSLPSGELAGPWRTLVGPSPRDRERFSTSPCIPIKFCYLVC